MPLVALVVIGRARLLAVIVPFTWSAVPGLVVPMPTLPFCWITRSPAPVELAIYRGLVPEVPCRDRVAIGLEEPMPMLPVEVWTKSWFVLTAKSPITVVVAKVEVALTVSPPLAKVKSEEVATPAPLPNRMSLAVRKEKPVPPAATGKTPVTSELPAPRLTPPIYRLPEAVDRTLPAVKEAKVAEPVIKVTPETERFVEEALPKVDWPLTNRGPETVRAVEEAEPKEEVAVTVREVKDGLGETAMVEVPEKTMLLPAVKKESGDL
jgi:hypothetical protein